MTLWSIEPRAPIILRDGRPFGLNPGARAESMDFPFPSTITGAVRTRHAGNKQISFSKDEVGELRKMAVRGPLLCEISDTLKWLVPAPVDALLFPATDKRDASHARLRRLQPLETSVISDLISTEPTDVQWQPIGMASGEQIKDKVLSTAPRYWRWQYFERWLLAPADDDKVDVAELGHNGPEKESRTHVSIRADTLTGEDGRLFQTRGLEFQHKIQSEIRSLALAIETNAEMTNGLGALGGERRLVRWRSYPNQTLPACPPTLGKTVGQAKYCRLILLTPAFFRKG